MLASTKTIHHQQRAVLSHCVQAATCVSLTLAAMSVRAEEVNLVVPVTSSGAAVVLTTEGRALYFPPPASAPYDLNAGLPAYGGRQSVLTMAPAGGGVVTLFSGGGAYFSPDGLFVGGGGATVPGYLGTQKITALAAAPGGVVTGFSGGGVYFSPDGMNLGGGGSSVTAYAGAQRVLGLAGIQGAVLTKFSGGGTYLSPTGRNLGGGGTTQAVPAWKMLNASPAFGPRDSSRLYAFANRWWLSSGFYASPNVSYFDLWSSSDAGANWQLQLGDSNPQVGPVANFYDPYSPLVTMGGRLFALGTSVWSTSTGGDWALLSPMGPGWATEDSFAFEMQGRLVYFNTQRQQVSFSDDGSSWTDGPALPFASRCGPAVVQAAGRVWVLAGGACDYSGFFTDSWYSDDGQTWHQAVDPGTGSASVVPFQGRMWPCLVSGASGTVWMVGGFARKAGAYVNLNDVWYAKAGGAWKQLKSTAGDAFSDTVLKPRHAPACALDLSTNRLTLAAGKGSDSPLNGDARVLSEVLTLDLPPDERLP